MFGSKITFKSVDGMTSYIINDRTSGTGQTRLWAQTPFYYIAVANVDGLYSADVTYESHPIPNATGEMSGDVFRTGKTITISGDITALSLGALERGADYLQQMFNETGKRKLIWTRWADGIEVYLTCRVNQDLSIAQTATSYEYRWEYVVGLRADDPRTRKTSGDTVYPTWQS